MESCALVLIDVQEDFIHAVENAFPKFNDNIVELLKYCRENKIDIIHVRAVYNDANSAWLPYYRFIRPSINGSVKEDPASFTVAKDGEKVIIKHTFDAFLNTDLDDYLKKHNKKQLLFAGVVTNCCVLFSVTGAFLRGYQPIVISDCCADRTIEKHDSSLSIHENMFLTTTLPQLSNFLSAKLPLLTKL